MNHDQLKQAAARAAFDYVASRLGPDSIIGIGTGSTTNYFIDMLPRLDVPFAGTVASSEASAERLRKLEIPVHDLNAVGEVSLYVDGADEVNPYLELIKGGGGALTREKIIADVTDEFICIVDESKCVKFLGEFPLPIEVIPMARGHVARELVKLGGRPDYREGAVTDNGNIILDVYDLHPIASPRDLEERINNIPGVVTNGLFALRPADRLLVAGPNGVETRERG